MNNEGLVEVEKTLMQILVRQLDLDIHDIRSDSFLREDLGMDSFSVLEVNYDIKEAFSIDILGEDISRIKTVRDLTRTIQNKLTSQVRS